MEFIDALYQECEHRRLRLRQSTPSRTPTPRPENPMKRHFTPLLIVFPILLIGCTKSDPPGPSLRLERDKNWLIIRPSDEKSGIAEIRINYLEAYCRPGSTDADWVKQTVIKHENELVEKSEDGKRIRLRDTLADGVIVDHVITANAGEIDFRLSVHNPTDKPSEAHWAQPCVRLGPFTGFNDPPKNSPTDYLPKCFIYINGRMTRMPFEPWAMQARYTPGQVWCPADVPRTDVNPRPLSSVVPSNGLIGCYSSDDKYIFATAWQPYQELFQGVARCLHSDFRIGGLKPGETKQIRGKIYILPADEKALLRRYAKDFPEQQAK
jgi:hypothetical protein